MTDFHKILRKHFNVVCVLSGDPPVTEEEYNERVMFPPGNAKPKWSAVEAVLDELYDPTPADVTAERNRRIAEAVGVPLADLSEARTNAAEEGASILDRIVSGDSTPKDIVRAAELRTKRRQVEVLEKKARELKTGERIPVDFKNDSYWTE